MPNSTQLREPERILQRLEWTVIRHLDGMLQGDYRSLFQGFGLDFEELREYQFGDDPRTIDWNVTARMREPFVRRYLEDREISAWFLVDLSPSLNFGTVNTSKRDLLVDFTALMMRLLTRHGNSVACAMYDGEKTRVIPMLSGRNQVLRIIRDLRALPSKKTTPNAKLSDLLEEAQKTMRKKSLVFVVSDFISPAGWERPLRILSRRHETIAVRILDPRESDIPDLGPLWLEDSESGEQIYVNTEDPRFRARFREAAFRHEESLRQSFRNSAVEALSLNTQDDLTKAVLRFAEMRKQMRSRFYA